MSSTLRAVAVGGLMALVAIVLLLVLRAPAPTDADRAERLSAELRCPDCQGLSVADSETTAAREIRRQVDELVAGGASDAEVRTHFTDRYGEWILLAPTAPALWIVPLAALVAMVGGLLVWLVRGQPSTGSAAVDDSAARRRVREEAEALDA
jgi:cytochrome c-type biogenesis protein CcmH